MSEDQIHEVLMDYFYTWRYSWVYDGILEHKPLAINEATLRLLKYLEYTGLKIVEKDYVATLP